MIDSYLNGNKVSDELRIKRQEFIDTWCDTVDGGATARTVEIINNLIQRKSVKARKPFQLKRWIKYLLLTIGDHFVHDIRVYGFMNRMRKIYSDKLGRKDKYFHKGDVIYWRNKLAGVLDRAE